MHTGLHLKLFFNTTTPSCHMYSDRNNQVSCSLAPGLVCGTWSHARGLSITVTADTVKAILHFLIDRKQLTKHQEIKTKIL